jgi:uncharacterized repeat protein (TIGR04138 family)
MDDIIEQLAVKSGKYKKEAFYYIAKAIESSHEKIKRKEHKRRHISGQELVDEIVMIAREEYGFLAKTVFKDWGIENTEDIGEIVFLMVDNGILTAQSSDSKDDFKDLFNLADMLEDRYDDFDTG